MRDVYVTNPQPVKTHFFHKTANTVYLLKINRLYLTFFKISFTFLFIFAIRQKAKDVFIPKNCRKTTIYKSEIL